MSKAKKAIKAKKLSKKDIAKEVYKKLEIALLGFKKDLKRTRFEKSLKKASKVFSKIVEKHTPIPKVKKKKKSSKTDKKVKAKK